MRILWLQAYLAVCNLHKLIGKQMSRLDPKTLCLRANLVQGYLIADCAWEKVILVSLSSRGGHKSGGLVGWLSSSLALIAGDLFMRMCTGHKTATLQTLTHLCLHQEDILHSVDSIEEEQLLMYDWHARHVLHLVDSCIVQCSTCWQSRCVLLDHHTMAVMI